MAVTKPAREARILPLAAIYTASLALVFIGERIVVAYDAARYVLTGLGVLGVLAATVMRLRLVATKDPERKAAERTLAFLSIGGVIALGLYFTSTDLGRELFGIAKAAPQTRARIQTVITVAWASGLVLSVLPLVFGEFALAPMRRAERIEARRVRSAIRSGVTLALAATYAALLTYATGELDLKLDFSYYRTARASESTKNIAGTASEPIQINAFFPQLNDVGLEVEGYLRDIGAASGHVKVASYDRLLVPAIAKEQRVTTDGMIVLSRGNARETVNVGADMKTSAAKLKTLDVDFQKALIKVLRPAKTIYFTTGHGELNELTEGADGRVAKRAKKLLEHQNYVVKDLGLVQGLGKEIPKDATIVFVLGPSKPFTEQEVETLKRYADEGGHLLLALDPDGKAELGPLAAIAGLTWANVPLANDKVYYALRKNISDRGVLVTNRFSSHASVSTLSRNSGKAAVGFRGASALDKAAGAQGKVDFSLKALPDTFGDANGNFEFDTDEKRSAYNLAAAVTKPVEGKSGKDAPEMRAFVVGDADCFSDVILSNEANAVFLVDALRWLGGEESFAGAITQTEDVRIEHTKQKDQLWFYATIFGVPLALVAVGLTRSRKPGRGKKAEGSKSKEKASS